MLKIKPHSIKTEKGETVELLTAVECKGIVGNDGRHYLLDLLRMMPPDLNYLAGSSRRKVTDEHSRAFFSGRRTSFVGDETIGLSSTLQTSAMLFTPRTDRRLHRVRDPCLVDHRGTSRSPFKAKIRRFLSFDRFEFVETTIDRDEHSDKRSFGTDQRRRSETNRQRHYRYFPSHVRCLK